MQEGTSYLTISTTDLLILKELLAKEVWIAKGKTLSESNVDFSYIDQVVKLYDEIVRLVNVRGLEITISITSSRP